jgi:hypothetical protein
MRVQEDRREGRWAPEMRGLAAQERDGDDANASQFTNRRCGARFCWRRRVSEVNAARHCRAILIPNSENMTAVLEIINANADSYAPNATSKHGLRYHVCTYAFQLSFGSNW